MNPLCVFWFRRDLRLEDNHGLYLALKSGLTILPIFIFDERILRELPPKDARVAFIRNRVQELPGVRVFTGEPVKVWANLFNNHNIKAVFCNEDYEPYAIERDKKVAALARAAGAAFHSVKDQVIFAKNEIVKDNGEPYRVFTPYSRAWLSKLNPQSLKPFKSGTAKPVLSIGKTLIRNYEKQRNRLDLDATSHLGAHLRFGTVSIRKIVQAAKSLSPTFLKELIWREFFMQTLFHFPHTVNEPFNPRYKNLPWRNNKKEFNKWCEGQTGYPIVDAGMRELNATGFMHNRARMITASFLTKHLLIDWRWGERYFAKHLLDFELASNVGNWQWVAGCGCDAAPYFRVFNPALQAKKFDPDGKYVKKWVPEAGTSQYPKPMVDHEFARRRALTVFHKALRTGPV